jgi:hypothetical protein
MMMFLLALGLNLQINLQYTESLLLNFFQVERRVVMGGREKRFNSL